MQKSEQLLTTSIYLNGQEAGGFGGFVDEVVTIRQNWDSDIAPAIFQGNGEIIMSYEVSGIV